MKLFHYVRGYNPLVFTALGLGSLVPRPSAWGEIVKPAEGLVKLVT